MSRPRLTKQLNAGLHRKLTLISAPAGFGKTTLLSEWAAGCNRLVAWVSLDKDDNDLARFLSYLVAALQSISPGIGAEILDTFQSPQLLSPESLVTMLINQINAAALECFILVLDDYHFITAQPVSTALSFLLDHLPAQMHLVIVSRADPPLSIARLRARGQLTELGQNDLCFTAEEATAFLNHVMKLKLSTENVAALNARTEGWIAGLQMAAISMLNEKDVARFVRAFTGSNRHVLDYLIEEVFQYQSKDVQDFVLTTSILERLTAPLCDIITGQTDGQAMLERLERANLFIVPLDSERQWYRYHQLFTDMLRQRLGQTRPDVVPELHRRASEWYERNNLTDEAIGHALSAGDLARAADLIERTAESTMLRSEVATLQRWLDALPDDIIRARPLLCVYHAMTLLLSGRPPNLAEACLQAAIAVTNARADTAGSIAGEVAACRAWLAAHQGQVGQYAELSRQALQLLPKESRFFRSIATGFLGLDSLFSGDVKAFDEAVRLGQQTGDLTMTLLALCHSADLTTFRGQLYGAQALYEQALELATEQDGQRQPIAGLALIGLGRLLREWNDLDGAAHYLVEGIELAQKWSETSVLQGYVALARVQQARGDAMAAREAIKIARRLAISPDAMQPNRTDIAVQEARLALVGDDVEAASRSVATCDLRFHLDDLERESNSGSFSLLQTLDTYVSLAWVRVAQGQPDEATTILASLLRASEAAGWTGIVIEILALQSLVHQSLGDVPQALVTLERALSLAKPEGYVRLFIEKGKPMRLLLQRLNAPREGGRLKDYTGKLLKAFSTDMIAPAPESEIIEPLSERERQVLRLLAQGLSDKAIAETLVIAVGTVNKHLKNIYGKLDAHSRTQAVARGRGLGLL